MGDRLVNSHLATQLETRVLDALAKHHASTPLSEGLPRDELRERALPGVPLEIGAAVLARLEQTGRMAGRERLAAAGHRLSLTAEEARVSDAIQQKAREAGYQAPDAQELAAFAGAPLDVVQRLVSLLTRQKQLVRL